MNEEQLKELDYPVVVDCGVVIGESVNDFQEWLFYHLVDLDMMRADLWDVIDFEALENKYGLNYSVYNNEDELLASYNMEDLEN